MTENAISQAYFSELLPVLANRAKLAAISRLGFANAPLRRHLAEVFDRPYGETGSFLADPTFEAVFGWRTADVTMAELAGSLLSQGLVQAMDQPPPELIKDYRFARTQRPYRHQLEAWRVLAGSPPQSLVVASGTGSGKTECFMVPILDRLARVQAEQKSRLIGVRALFLYPLNALINSQRERLRAWTHAFGGDLRFCLYNGNTSERLPASVLHEHPSEVLDRASLRASPPPILVTNATMLEYMLVRTADAPILAQSRGKLEWVVLDEAHTYVGSQAAEAALLIRRVLFAFGVVPEQVRFVATSATIGDPEGEAGQKLRRFLAEVAGIPDERVHLVAGEREIPSLDVKRPTSKVPLTPLAEIDSAEESSSPRYDALVDHVIARKLRDLFVGTVGRAPIARLSEVCAVLFGAGHPFTAQQQGEALQWLDLLSGTRNPRSLESDDRTPFLPLRAHLFHQSMSGLWACADAHCVKKRGCALDDRDWPFGRVYFEPRKHCDCGRPAYEVVACDDCGTVHLLAGEYRGRLTHFQTQAALDEFELEAEPKGDEPDQDAELDEQPATGRQNKVLIVNRHLPHVSELSIDRDTRQLCEPNDGALRVMAHEDGGEGLQCPACGGQESRTNQLFQHSRLGAPFLLGGILPTLLEYAPDGDKPADHPCRGRRLLTFNDSRQGTARMAAKLQQDAERNRVRGLVYHLALQHGCGQASTRESELRAEIDTLQKAAASAPSPALEQLIDAKRAELVRLRRPVPIPFNELAQRLANQGRDFDSMLSTYRRQTPGTFGEAGGPIELARMLLVREFGRRPKRLNNLESMGLVAVRYPSLDDIRSVPPIVQTAAGFDLETWRDFLKICLDFFVRAGGTLAISLSWRDWLGMPFPQSQLVPRDEVHVARNQRRWPRTRRSGPRSTLVRLLAYVLQADVASDHGEDRVDAVLQAAWDALTGAGLLRQEGDGRVLPIERLAFAPITNAWICPVTRRILDATLRGVTPYLPAHASEGTANCRRIDVPMYPEPFASVTDDLERIRRGRAWVTQNEKVAELREEGLWSDLNDRVIELAPYFTAAEHSAQQSSVTLDRYEKAFKMGDLNLLSCSTTMEMGIDIGGVSMVAMNNVPPHPANYLQRAGRAGRRREGRSLALTLCKSNPLDQSVFVDTRWPFAAPLPAPRVSLDSAVIVQRHAQSLLLSHYLAESLAGSGQEQTKLTCGLFFLGENPIAERYTAWCRAFTRQRMPELADGLTRLVRHSVFEGRDLSRLAQDAATEMDEVCQQWGVDWTRLEKEEREVRAAGENSPAFRAVTIQKSRMSGEYLLRELATRGYLPAYGFPTHIASFDNLTRAHIRQQQDRGREDNRYRRRELASRDLMSALREYAPGSEVVMDGLVYRSAGVTLNWHVPADQQDVSEIQNIRHVWRCHRCGASGSTHTLEAARHCDSCGADVEGANVREFLEPAGFSVDFYESPGNDITSQHFVPVEPPWIDARGDWFSLPNPGLGRFRVSDRGHVFHHSRGVHGYGYALCLECGRAEPMVSEDAIPVAFQRPHAKLRRAREEGVYCPGSENPWKIKLGITLGHETWTDIFELQLKTVSGAWLTDRTAAWTLAVALRDSLADAIGVQATELGCDIKDARPHSGARCQSILIFDRFAAGYASSADRYLDGLFKRARRRLECSTTCDSACPRCVLSFDYRFAADSLDRHAALALLTEAWLNSLALPKELRLFGPESRAEYRRLPESIWQVVMRRRESGIRLYAAGSADSWDVGPSPLRKLAYRLAGEGAAVEIAIPNAVIEAADENERSLLASLADHPNIRVYEIAGSAPRCGDGWLVAETLGTPACRWGLTAESMLAFGANWGQSEGQLILHESAVASALQGKKLDARSLRPRSTEATDREIEIHHELDGPLQGYGKRLWMHLTERHTLTRNLIADPKTSITSIVYRDRYLFSPLAIALLAQVLAGLRDMVGSERWRASPLRIVTLSRGRAVETRARNTVWADWPDTDIRDEVLVETCRLLRIDAVVNASGSAETGHGRILEVGWSTGRTLALRLDQGVSYWRASPRNSRSQVHFQPNSEDVRSQAARVTQLAILIEGAELPTQLFLKVR